MGWLYQLLPLLDGEEVILYLNGAGPASDLDPEIIYWPDSEIGRGQLHFLYGTAGQQIVLLFIPNRESGCHWLRTCENQILHFTNDPSPKIALYAGRAYISLPDRLREIGRVIVQPLIGAALPSNMVTFVMGAV